MGSQYLPANNNSPETITVEFEHGKCNSNSNRKYIRHFTQFLSDFVAGLQSIYNYN